MSKVILGIDVSKSKLSIALLKNERFFCDEVDNNPAGFNKLIEFLSQKMIERAEKLEIYLEATGSYSESVADFLFDHKFDVKVVNPLKIHSIYEGQIIEK